ncbi:hypothetical protein Nepgr_024610 [Nepenthes gracilis]|uniref:Uncharacterized protein n=1 Tax=Nepenthes gracilis TaxID=150966 RepID=A0AAD3XYS3_NEPGR|nr:hypothetical protein Nepgr_024610 [Nepenthes gracilis]
MATGWVKSLQCRSRAFEDVYNPTAKSLLPSASCKKSVQGLKDVIETATSKPRKHRQQPPLAPPISKSKSQPASFPADRVVKRSASARPNKGPDPLFPSLCELPEGHPSRNVVEIIFQTRWTPKPFTGRIEMVFKIQNMQKTVSRFEDYREAVKNRAGSRSARDDLCKYEDTARCVADGNEMMRFHCLGATSGVIDGCVGISAIHGGKGPAAATAAAICTFSGSGAAHDNAGGGKGRRAMLVCRVVAGLVSKRLGLDSVSERLVGFDSVSGANGELLVFDSRAVLPCFLVIYKL